MRRIYYIMIGVTAALLFASCGKQGDAERLVEDFVEQNAIAPEKMKRLEFGKLDSTRLIKDSLLLAMQQRSHEHFKGDIDYSAKTSGRMLYFLRMRFTYDEDTLQHTFYMDEALHEVVAFK